ncbi:MAG: glycosyltransferase family protein [Magnetococcales bacterium]|nr:glycosyltransferase family protein [Magnetococcales bacterium]
MDEQNSIQDNSCQDNINSENYLKAKKALQQGTSLLLSKQYVKAIKCLSDCLAIKPNNISALSNLGFALQSVGKVDEAIICYNKAIALAPQYLQAHYNLGNAQREQGKLADAVASYKRVITLNPDYVSAHYNLGYTLQNHGTLDEVIDCYKKVLAIDPKHRDAMNNLGNALFDQGKLSQAATCFEKAIALDPGYADAHNNLSLTQLLKGDFANGWIKSKWRWKTDQVNSERYLKYEKYLWQGESLKNKKLMLWTEQGVGENILFSSMLPDLFKLGAKVFVEFDPRLIPLFKRTYPSITCITPQKEQSQEEQTPKYDYIIPLGDLGCWLRKDISYFPKQPSWLVHDIKRAESIRSRYLANGNKYVIGLSWRSNSLKYKYKSIKLRDLMPILEIPGVTFVNLQYGDTTQERAELRQHSGIDVIDDSEVDQMADLDGFAAQIAAMDMVVTISNTAAHMAGALGVPTLLMLGVTPIWYWMLERDYSIWYSSVKICRQKNLTDWSDVIAQVTDGVKNMLDKPASG